MKCLTDSRSLKRWWKIRLEGESKCFAQIMVESTLQEDSLISVEKQELRGSSQFPTTRSRMEWQKGRTGRLFQQLEQCYMIRDYRCIFALKLVVPQCMCKTRAHIGDWETLHLRRISLEKSLRSVTPWIFGCPG